MIRNDYEWKHMSQKLNALIDDEIMEAIKTIAKKDERSISQTANLLLREAVAARLKKSD